MKYELDTIPIGERMTLKQIEAEVWRLLFVICKGLLGALAAILEINVIVFYFVAQNLAVVTVKFSRLVINWNPEKPAIFERS